MAPRSLGALEAVNRHAFHSRWLPGGMSNEELTEHLMSLPIDLQPITCLVQARGTGKSRLLYETSLRTPSLYAALASSSYGSYPPPAKFAPSILSLRKADDVVTLLAQWVDKLSDHFDIQPRGTHWFLHQVSSSSTLKLNGRPQKDDYKRLERSLIRCALISGRDRIFLLLDEAQAILDDPNLSLYRTLREGLIKINSTTKSGCAIVCVLAGTVLPPVGLRAQLYSELGSARFYATDIYDPVYALGAQGIPRVFHPSGDMAHFCSTAASMRRFGRPCWRNALSDDAITTLFTQRMALMRRAAGVQNFYRALASMTANLRLRPTPETARQLLRYGWAQLVEYEEGGLSLGVAYPSEPFLASIALGYLRQNNEVGAMFDVLIADARKRMWETEDRHSLVARLLVLRALCNGRGWLVPVSEFFSKLWDKYPGWSLLQQTLPTKVRDYKVNMNHFIRPDESQLMRVSLASFYQRCAGWIVSSQFHHYDFVIPLWTGESEEMLQEAKMSAAFISIADDKRTQTPRTLFASFLKGLQRAADCLAAGATLSPTMELLDRIAKPAVFVVLDASCRDPTIVHMDPKFKPSTLPIHQQRAVSFMYPLGEELELDRSVSQTLSEVETHCPSRGTGSEPRTSIDQGHCELEAHGTDVCAKLAQKRRPSASDWIVIHAPLYPAVEHSPLWIRAVTLSMDPSSSTEVIRNFQGPRATSLFYHRAMSTTPTSLLVDS